MNTPDVIAYRLHGNLYLNITNRCTLRCAFCPKFNGVWAVQGYDLRTHHEPSVKEILEAVGDPHSYHEVVFCGLGEPMLRLYPLLEVAARLHSQGAHVRVNTDGLANLAMLFAAEVGENDIKLFQQHLLNQRGPKPRVVEVAIDPKTKVGFEWNHSNLDVGVREGRKAVKRLLKQDSTLASAMKSP